jgi:hypothetical protein
MRYIVGHDRNGDITVASLSPEARAAGMTGMHIELAQIAADGAYGEIHQLLAKWVQNGVLSRVQASRLEYDAVNRALDAAGFIDYKSTLNSDIPQHLMRLAIRKGMEVLQPFREQWLPGLSERETQGAIDNAAKSFRRSELLDSLPTKSGPDAARRSGSDPVQAGSRPILGPDGGRLGESPRSPFDGAVEDVARTAVEEAGGDTRSPRFRDVMLREMEANLATVGGWHHRLSAIGQHFTSLLGLGGVDPISAPKVNAILGHSENTKALLSQFIDQMPSWRNKPIADWNRILRAAELATLLGRDVPLDGRAIILTNDGSSTALMHTGAATRDPARRIQPPDFAAGTPGETVRLTDPGDIQMYKELRQTLNGIWDAYLSAIGREYNWTGVPRAAAIAAAARAETDPARARELTNAATAVGNVEYARRTSYLPLMRDGNWIVRVKPIAAGPDDPLNRWDGSGTPPTVYMELVKTNAITWRQPWETAKDLLIGGRRSMVPQEGRDAEARIRAMFPEDRYTIESNWLVDSTNGARTFLRDISIPLADRAMVAMSSDIRGQTEAALRRAGIAPADAARMAREQYTRFQEEMRDAILNERSRSWRRQRSGVAGYSDDFTKSVSRYMGQLAAAISDVQYRPIMEAADFMIARHPDERTRKWWADWEQNRQDQGGDTMDSAFNKARRGVFYYLLGGNFATTTKILLHGPFRGIPILSTGVNPALATGQWTKAFAQVMTGFRANSHDGLTFNLDNVTRDPREQALIQRSLDGGIIHEHNADENRALSQTGEEALVPNARIITRALNIWSSNVSAADKLVRAAQLLAAYRLANQVGMDRINRVWGRDQLWAATQEKTPEAFAQFMVRKTVGISGQLNSIPLFRSQLGRFMFQFRNYEAGYIQNMFQLFKNMGPEGILAGTLMMGGMTLFGGLAATPFFVDAEEAGNWLMKLFDKEWPGWEEHIRQASEDFGHEVLGVKGAGEVAMHGFRPGGIDWSSIGLGDLLSRELNADTGSPTLGAALSSLYRTISGAISRETSGQDPKSVLFELLPNALKHALQSFYPETMAEPGVSGKYTQPPMSEADRWRHALGFQTETAALSREPHQRYVQLRKQYQDITDNAITRYTNLIAQGRTAEAETTMRTVMQQIANGRARQILSQYDYTQFHRKLMNAEKRRFQPGLPGKQEQRFQENNPIPGLPPPTYAPPPQ